MAAPDSRRRISTGPRRSGFRAAATQYVLRVDHREVLVDRPRLVIGRATASDLQLDGASISRQHAAVFQTEEGLVLEDLNSRNGVFVNGVLIGQPFRLEDGDFIRIGDHDIEVARFGSPTPSELPLGDEDEDEEVSTRRVNPLEVLSGIVEHALEQGDYQEAEAVIGGYLRALHTDVRAGKTVQGPVVHTASRYALRLAAASGRGQWVDFVIEMYLSLRRAMPLAIVRELFRLAPIARYQDRGILARYLDMLGESAPTMGGDATLVLERMRRYGRL